MAISNVTFSPVNNNQVPKFINRRLFFVCLFVCLFSRRKEYSLVGEDIARAFLAAARKKDTAIVRCILKHHIEVIWIDVTESKKNVWEIAISEGLSSVFEVFQVTIWLRKYIHVITSVGYSSAR